jgi:hypothetical protein
MSLKTRNFDKSAGGCAGLAATANLKHDPATASIPLIAFSALGYKEFYAVMKGHLLEPEQAEKLATPPTWSPT